MQARKLTLVIPAEIKATYKPEQYPVLLTISEFIELVKGRQRTIGYVPMPIVNQSKTPKQSRKKN